VGSGKVTSQHLGRKAVVYVRQSTDRQVQQNTESRRLQEGLVERARTLGFRDVELVEADLGCSAGVGAARREGFDRLIASVAVGEVGIILSREVSRLVRPDKDWCRLMEVCQLFGTLIGDEEQVYDLALTDDQLILGIKGTMSVVELRILHMRLVAGMEAKARRGEMVRLLPPGYVYDGDGKVVKDPDQRVAQAIEMVFQKFREIGSVRQTMLWFRSAGMELPVNKSVGGKMRIVWRAPTLCFVRSVLGNAFYAGAYLWGRRPQEKVVVEGRLVKRTARQHRAEECRVCIRDHHEPYVAWDCFQEVQRMIEENNTQRGSEEAAGAVREGQGLLAGLLRCGRCGRKLHVRYWGKRGTSARYACIGDFSEGGNYCVSFGGAGVDRRFGEELLKVLSPLGMEASLMAAERLEQQGEQRWEAMRRQLEQTEYAARKAFEQYDEVDARNRLVASELERRWNEKLEEVQRLKAALSEQEQKRHVLSEQEREEILSLGDEVAAVWHSPSAPATLRKRIIRTVIEEVIADVDDERKTLSFTIRWKGGSHTRFAMPKPAGAASQRTSAEDAEIIRRMATRYGDDMIARVLNMLGRKTGKGNRWTMLRVATARKRAGIPGQSRTKEDPGTLTVVGAAREYGVSTWTIKRLADCGLLHKGQAGPWAPWEISRADMESDAIQSIIRKLKQTGRLDLDLEGDGVGTQKALFPVEQGDSNAR
jgi:DNA invertase Pin-like site-specific DNA recombinase